MPPSFDEDFLVLSETARLMQIAIDVSTSHLEICSQQLMGGSSCSKLNRADSARRSDSQLYSEQPVLDIMFGKYQHLLL